jgi:hypothetical protein
VSLRYDYSLRPLLPGVTTLCKSALLFSLHCNERDDYIDRHYID